MHSIVSLRYQRTGACKQRQHVNGSAVCHGGAAVIALRGRCYVNPSRAGGEGDGALGGALGQHRSYEHVAPPQVFVRDGVEGGAEAAVVEVDWAHEGIALGGVLPGQGVVVREPAVALFDEALDGGGVLGVEVWLGVLLRVSAQYRGEEAQLQPSDIKLGYIRLGGINGKSTHVMAHISQAAEAGVEHNGDLRLQSAPGARHVSGPGIHRVTLESCGAAAHHRHQAPGGIVFFEEVIDDAAPVVAVLVVVFAGVEAVGVDHSLGVHFRLAQVAPPSGDAHVGEFFVSLSQPLACQVVGDVPHAAFAYPYLHIVGLSGGVAHKQALRRQGVVIVNGAAVAQHIRLRYNHHVYALALEVFEHLDGGGPL